MKHPTRPTSKTNERLNVGCGRQYHPAWTNVDLVASGEGVIEHDLTTGIPFAENTFAAVYHSHVLEHLEPEAAKAMLNECFRVLQPGGVIRVVVPDLESIARLYLHHLERACQDEPDAAGHYDWMLLEMIDQLVRSRSGGKMAETILGSDETLRPFLSERLGDELNNCEDSAGTPAKGKPPIFSWGYIQRKLGKLKRKLGARLLPIVGPGVDKEILTEAQFRRSGEVHKWMYDRYSLARLLAECGFTNVAKVGPTESRIDQFESYQLDTIEGRTRKPDSLFVEGTKPSEAAVRAA